jgi:hypothetical protein
MPEASSEVIEKTWGVHGCGIFSLKWTYIVNQNNMISKEFSKGVQGFCCYLVVIATGMFSRSVC